MSGEKNRHNPVFVGFVVLLLAMFIVWAGTGATCITVADGDDDDDDDTAAGDDDVDDDDADDDAGTGDPYADCVTFYEDCGMDGESLCATLDGYTSAGECYDIAISDLFQCYADAGCTDSDALMACYNQYTDDVTACAG